MTDSEMSAEPTGTSRRALLKGAVGAGVGLAAWSAPKIGVVPAYALTNSTGVFDGVCYYIVWNAGNRQEWTRGVGPPGQGKDTGRPSTIAPAGPFNATYTWNDVFGLGQDLVVDVSGSPQPHDPTRPGPPGAGHNQRDHDDITETPYPNEGLPGETVPATITLTTAPAGCTFEDTGLGVTYGMRPDNPGCTLPASVRTGWSATTGAVPTATVVLQPTSGTVTDVRDDTNANYIIFNIVCA